MKSNQKAAIVRAAIAKHEEFILNSLTSRILGRTLQNVVSATSILKTLGNRNVLAAISQSKMLIQQIWGASIWMRNQKILISTNLSGG